MNDESLFSATTHIINTDLMNYSDIVIKRCLRTDLRDWTLKHHCPRAWLNDLLVILRNHGNNLPKDYRTLLQTPRQTTYEKLCGGDFKYFGIEYCIINALVSFAEFPLSIELKVNVDGVPLWKLSPEQFWPILGMFDQSAVFIIGIYYGKQKPNNIEDFLGRFLDEMAILEKDGIELNGQKLKARILNTFLFLKIVSELCIILEIVNFEIALFIALIKIIDKI